MNISLKSILLILVGVCILGFVYLGFFASSTNQKFNPQLAANDITPFSNYDRGLITAVLEQSEEEFSNNQIIYQLLEVEIRSGVNKGSKVNIESSGVLELNSSNVYKAGDRVVLGSFADGSNSTETESLISPQDIEYVVVDRYRSNGLYLIIALFVVAAIVIGRRQGAMSLLGLVLTGLIMLFFIAPQILNGKNAILIALTGGMAIALITMFISHGYNVRTKLSVISTLITLFLTALLSFSFVYLANLFGLGQNDAFILETGFIDLDMRGILLASILISVLGVLDDVTTTQTASVEELQLVDPEMSKKELFARGMSIGREHIASLVNTLILVYAGASLPLFLLLTSVSDQPLWVLINSEYMAEEIVRAISGSLGLILAVPISTVIAVSYYKKSPPVKREDNLEV